MLFADDLELSLLGHFRLGGQSRGIEGALAQALFQTGLVLADLAVDIFLSVVNGRAHIAFPIFLLRAEQRVPAPNGYLDDTAIIFLHREGDVSLRFSLKVAVQLGNFLFRILLYGIAQLNFLGGKRELHTIYSFRLR